MDWVSKMESGSPLHHCRGPCQGWGGGVLWPLPKQQHCVTSGCEEAPLPWCGLPVWPPAHCLWPAGSHVDQARFWSAGGGAGGLVSESQVIFIQWFVVPRNIDGDGGDIELHWNHKIVMKIKLLMRLFYHSLENQWSSRRAVVRLWIDN